MPQPSTADEADRDGWRASLQPYLERDATARAEQFTQLALQFELRELTPRTPQRWNGPTSRAATAASFAADAPLRLGVRPVARTARGWARGSLRWSNIQHVLNRMNLDPEQHRWFTQFGALHRAAAAAIPGQEADWVYLDDFVNPVLWRLLQQAEQLGIAFVGPRGGDGVELAVEASLTLHATRVSGGIELAPSLVVDGEPAPLACARAIGDHGVYLFDPAAPGALTIAPSRLQLSQRQLGLLSERRSETVHIPDAAVADFITDYLPAIRDSIEIVADDGIELPEGETQPATRPSTHGTPPRYRQLRGEPHLTVTTVPTESNDWFELGVVVRVDGHSIPFTPLFKALAKGQKRLKLVDGSYLSLRHPAFEVLLELIAEAQDLGEWLPNPRISRHQTELWADFEDLADESQPAAEWRTLVEAVNGEHREVAPVPEGLTATLRPYQQEGFEWLATLAGFGLGGVLADDMGLGKTLQCLALVQHLRESGGSRGAPFLVVAPTSVASNWVAEAAHFAPELVVARATSTESAGGASVASLAAGADIVVTSYALLRLDFDAYQRVALGEGWAGLILDEAQFIKNRSARVHECARDLQVPFKLAVTGTPMENSLTELHALFSVVAPGLFPSARRFAEQYVKVIEGARPGITGGVGAGQAPQTTAEARASALGRLRRRIRPFLLRRTKDDVAAELPARQEQTVSVELDPAHRDLYDVFLQRERQKLFGLLDDLDRNRFIVFRSLTLLRLLALDASLLGPEHADVPSSKLDALLEHLDDAVAEGHRSLVFSQFTSYLSLVAARLDAAGIPYVSLDGTTRDRDAVIDGFRGGTAPVFLISLKAGGFGLNLTEADYVFLLDPWWNPAAEQQAIDRAHRIGQRRTVMVYRLISEGTIEERVMRLGQRKGALFDAVFDEDSPFAAALTADDIRELLTE